MSELEILPSQEVEGGEGVKLFLSLYGKFLRVLRPGNSVPVPG